MESRMRAWQWWAVAGLCAISGLVLYRLTKNPVSAVVKSPVSSLPLVEKPKSGEPVMLSWELDLNSGVGSIGAVTWLGFLPDGKTLAVSSEDLRVRSWDAETGQLKNTVSLQSESLFGGSAFVGSPAGLSPNAKLLVTVSHRDALKLWDAQTGQMKWRGDWSGGPVVFSADGKTLLSMSGGQQAQKGSFLFLWDVDTGRATRMKIETPGEVRAFGLSHDSKTLATVGEVGGVARGTTYYSGKGDVRIWEIKTGKLLRAFSGLHSPAQAVAFSPDDKTLAVGTSFESVTLWSVASGQRLKSLLGKRSGRHGGEFMGAVEVHALTYSPDGSLLAGAGYRDAQLWNARTGEFLQQFTMLIQPEYAGNPDVGQIAFSPDSSILALGGERQRTVTLHHIK